MFFTVMWRGVCQTLGWVLGLFGFGRDGRMAKCVWGVFSVSAAVSMAIIAALIVYGVGSEVYDWYDRHYNSCEDTWLDENYLVYGDIYFHRQDDLKGYIYNAETHEKLVRPVRWIEEPLGNDSLVSFDDGRKWGFFSKLTGKVIIAPKYDRAYKFSDGLACVAEDGLVKFIDATGQVVIDTKMTYKPDRCDYVFMGGYYIAPTEDGKYYGMMDRTGKIVVPKEYDRIEVADDMTLWFLYKDGEVAVMDKELNLVLEPMECDVEYADGCIFTMMSDHTLRCYDRRGTLLNDFCIRGIEMLEYETDEVVTLTTKPDGEEDDFEDDEPRVETYHRKATARLRCYQTAAGYCGLMTAEGLAVTGPIYEDVSAIGADTYLCTLKGDVKVVVNGARIGGE